MGYGLYDRFVDDLFKLLGLDGQIQASLRSTLIDSLEMTTILLFLIVNTIMLIWLERKVWPRMMNMRGIVFIDFNWGHFFSWPFGKRTWKFGLLQNIAEFLKFFSKEDIVPEKADKFPFNIGFFAFIVAPPFMLGALLPLGGEAVIADPAVGFLLIFSLFALYPVGVLITGWSSNNKYSLLGAFRSAAQMISYEIPLILSVGAVVLVSNSFSLVEIANQQTTTPLGLPFAIFMPIGFIVFLTALAAETERVPFDIPEAEAELVMGWRTELTGFRYMMSMATEYFILLIGAFVGVSLFLGGSYLPLPGFKAWVDNFPLIYAFIFTAKLWVFIFLYIWIRSALPRVRIDQLLDIGWKRLLPLAILNIIIVIFMILLIPQIFGVLA